jgi:hypothetical protein
MDQPETAVVAGFWNAFCIPMGIEMLSVAARSWCVACAGDGRNAGKPCTSCVRTDGTGFRVSVSRNDEALTGKLPSAPLMSAGWRDCACAFGQRLEVLVAARLAISALWVPTDRRRALRHHSRFNTHLCQFLCVILLLCMTSLRADECDWFLRSELVGICKRSWHIFKRTSDVLLGQPEERTDIWGNRWPWPRPWSRETDNLSRALNQIPSSQMLYTG